MGEDKQIQKAGDNSQQIQANNIYIHNGLTEEQVRLICAEMTQKAIADCTFTATQIAKDHIDKFNSVLIPHIQQIESDFNSFTDPSFQVLLRKAQLTAACSGKDEDYKILSELLIHRVKNKTNIKKKASITKAVEIVDQIDDDSLLGLTFFLLITYFVPRTGVISAGLGVLNDLYSKLDLESLPKGDLWLDNLSILGAITTNTIVSPIPFCEGMYSSLPGYVCAGIKKDSENYLRAQEILNNTRFHSKILVDNELLEGYVRLPISQSKIPDEIIVEVSSIKDYSLNSISFPHSIGYVLSDLEKEAFSSILELYDRDSSVIATVKKEFKEIMQNYPSINKAMMWWDSLEHSITLTSVGKVIAHTNAKSINPTLPDLD